MKPNESRNEPNAKSEGIQNIPEVAPLPRVTISCMLNWYLDHMAKGLQERDSLCGFWSSMGNHAGFSSTAYRRIWPYYLLKKPSFHLPFVYFEDISRWWCLPEVLFETLESSGSSGSALLLSYLPSPGFVLAHIGQTGPHPSLPDA